MVQSSTNKSMVSKEDIDRKIIVRCGSLGYLVNKTGMFEKWLVVSGFLSEKRRDNQNKEFPASTYIYLKPQERISLFNHATVECVLSLAEISELDLSPKKDKETADNFVKSDYLERIFGETNFYAGNPTTKNDYMGREGGRPVPDFSAKFSLLSVLDKIGNADLTAYVVDRANKDPDFAEYLIYSLTGKFNTSQIENTKDKCKSELDVNIPAKAPRLWVDRPVEERDMNAVAWIRKIYAPWLGRGLARHHVGQLDPALGKAYSSWTRKERHPEDIIQEFAEGNPYGRLDDAEAGRRNRASTRASQIRAKAAKMPQPS